MSANATTEGSAINGARLIACHECDLLQEEISLPPGKVARCARCGAKLYRSPHASVDTTLAYWLTALLVFFIANCYPIVGIDIRGTQHHTTLIGAVVALWRQEMVIISLLVFLTTCFFPAVQIFFMLNLLVAIRGGNRPPLLGVSMRVLQGVNPWGMVEVFLLGVLVALVKLTHFAQVISGIALWSFGVLIVLLAAAASTFDVRDVWERVSPAPALSAGALKGGGRTAAQLGIFSCHGCGLLSQADPAGDADHCHCLRCGSSLHFRKQDSCSRSWAFLIAAAIMYVPANVLPIMETGSLFGAQSDTIMSGVIYLWHSGSWDLALVVFTASVMVPLMKLVALSVLLVFAQRRSTWQPLQRTKLYRIVELVGRWSMLDIYVVTILAALVQLGSLATITAGPAALAFGAVVVLTMFAAMEFEPRLIWDPLQEERIEHG